MYVKIHLCWENNFQHFEKEWKPLRDHYHANVWKLMSWNFPGITKIAQKDKLTVFDM